MNKPSSEQLSISAQVEKNLKRRYRTERIFRACGMASIGFGILCLLVLFGDIISKGTGAFRATYIQLEVKFDPAKLGVDATSDESALKFASTGAIIKQAMRDRFPEVSGRSDKRKLYALVSGEAEYTLKDQLVADPQLIGTQQTIWLLADDDTDVYFKHGFGQENEIGRLNDKQKQWVAELVEAGQVETQFNTLFFTRADSREPESAGIWGAARGSFFTLLVTLLLSFPIGVAAAIYLEEFAPKNKLTDLIEVNINNLAAVPSIIFGLLGLAIFINFFGMPRSIPLVGGIVLTLMTLPTIIISSRAAIKAVPPSIREAALGMGASKVQVVLHHVLPLAMPGMLTGTIIGMAQALGETAPLLMIGMVAFIVDIPGGVTDPATVLPVQIFLWADSPERAFVERTSAAIMVLLAFLMVMNTAAVMLRKRLERRW